MAERWWCRIGVCGYGVFMLGMLLFMIGAPESIAGPTGVLGLSGQALSYLLYSTTAAAEHSRRTGHPPGALALALAIGALFAVPSVARAEVDCFWSNVECRDGAECAWDAERHVHRCLSVPTETAPGSQCVMQDENDCPTDYPHEYRACLRAVRAHNAACMGRNAACADAREIARIACTAEEKGGTFDRHIAESVAACGRARSVITVACAPPPPPAPTASQRAPLPDPVRCSIRIGGHPTCPP